MRPLDAFPMQARRLVKGVLTDIDDTLTMTRLLLAECFAVDLDAEKGSFVFVGDSPNDAPMFAFFPHAVGTANVRDVEDRMPATPAYVTERPAGAGFAELAAALLEARG